MDPTNNPIPTPNPVPTPEPASEPAPEPTAPTNPVTSSESVSADAPTPTAPVSAEPVVPNPTPVNPVVIPGTNPIAGNPAFQQNGGQGLAATDPIMQPEPAKAPDPVEEELKAPMKAAEPVPGSIGSAVSGPESGAEPAGATSGAVGENPFAETHGQTPSVAFNDPAAQPDGAANPAAVKPEKKKTSKATWIALIVVAMMVVVALAAVLIMTVIPSSGNNQTSSNSGTSSTTQNTSNTSNTSTNSNDDTDTQSDTDMTDLASIEVLCSTDTATADVTMKQTATFQIVNGKLTGAKIATITTDTEGVTDEEEQTVTYEDLVKEGLITSDTTFVETDGTLTVTADKMANEFETWLNSSAEDQVAVYSCEIL